MEIIFFSCIVRIPSEGGYCLHMSSLMRVYHVTWQLEMYDHVRVLLSAYAVKSVHCMLFIILTVVRISLDIILDCEIFLF